MSFPTVADTVAVSYTHLIEIRLPLPFQPVFTKYALAPTLFIFLTSSSAYLVGCNDKQACLLYTSFSYPHCQGSFSTIIFSVELKVLSQVGNTV